LDEFSREYVLKVVDFSISGHRVARELDRISWKLPKTIVVDNEPEFRSKATYFWATKAQVKLYFIQPAKPTQDAFIESFNRKMRACCLDLHGFASIDEARSTIDDWQRHTTTSDRTAHSARNRPQCSQRKRPDMLNFPHGPMLSFRGALIGIKAAATDAFDGKAAV
jgi:transposase InsO family protein